MNQPASLNSNPLSRALSSAERKTVAALNTPAKIQAFLEGMPYSTDGRYRCPLSVLRDRRAHCYDGAVFAAAMLERLGYPPLIVNMFAYRDDEHLIAPFRLEASWGALGKSNFVGLRYREPVYRSVRELVISYFEDYYNMERHRSLRSYTRPLNLRAFARLDWETDDAAMATLAARLDALPRRPLLTPRMVRRLTRLDQRSFEAGMLGTDPEGVYRHDAK